MARRIHTAASWDDEYARGRYRNEPPLPFVDDIIAAAHRRGVANRPGLYIGCGNGRNYLPLTAGGLDFFAQDELSDLMGTAFDVELPLRLDRTERGAPASGHWSQWETIWRRLTPDPAGGSSPASAVSTGGRARSDCGS